MEYRLAKFIIAEIPALLDAVRYVDLSQGESE